MTTKLNQTESLITYEWYGKLYTSQDRLNDLYMKGLISREFQEDEENRRTYYTFRTKQGDKIASFYIYWGYGFSTQPTGIELHNVKTI